MNLDNERRQFSRIPFDAMAHIKSNHDDVYLNCHVVDVSLHGVLIQKPGQCHLLQDEPCHVELLLEQGKIVIEMLALVAHIDDAYIGLVWKQIDVDSITHLRRLIELNLEDGKLLHREVAALVNPH